jgi:hypothetical protein
MRLSRKEITGKYAVKNCGEGCAKWKYDAIGGDNIYQFSNLVTVS